jgi:hypothetical protein
VVLRGSGRTLTAGYDLQPDDSDDPLASWGSPYDAPGPRARNGAWDPVRDMQFMGQNVKRFEHIPANQLALNKLLINQAFENMGLRTTQLLGTIFDGVARHTEETYRWVESFPEKGFRQVIAERDEPFGDYGARP